MTDFKKWAPMAPMGWNSWDCFGASVTEKEIKANANYVAKHLKKFGYEYIIVDIQWYEATADSSIYHAFADLEIDTLGRLLPAVNRFPSAKSGAGFAPLAQYIHDLGLKFGIHIMRGVPRQAVHQNMTLAGGFKARDVAANNICPWNSDMYGLDMKRPGAQEYYNSLMDLYAQWGIDFIKVDDICDSELYGMHQDEIKAIRQAIDQTGRSMVLSLSPGPADVNKGSFLQQHANMWRLTNDFWDTWKQLKGMFPVAAKWAPFVRQGNWPDPDMLPLGAIRQRSVDGGTNLPHSRFTNAETKTMLTLWSLLRAPMFLGGDLVQSGDEEKLYTNAGLLKMRQEITDAWQADSSDDDLVIWRAEGAAKYVAAFNIGETDKYVSLTELDIEQQAVDIWQDSIIASDVYTVVPHGVSLLKI